MRHSIELLVRKCVFFVKVSRRKPEIVSRKAAELHDGYALEVLKDKGATADELLMAVGVHRTILIQQGLIAEPEHETCNACQDYFLVVNIRVANKLPVPKELHDYKKIIQCQNECQHNPDEFRRPVTPLATTEADILGSHWGTKSGPHW